MSIRRGIDFDYGSGSYDSSSDAGSYHDAYPAAHAAPFSTSHASSNTAALSARVQRELGLLARPPSPGYPSDTFSWSSNARRSSDLYIDRRDGVYRSSDRSNSDLSLRSRSSERRRRDRAELEMDRIRDGRMRDWLDGGTGTLRRVGSFDRARPLRPISPSPPRPRSRLRSRARSPAGSFAQLSLRARTESILDRGRERTRSQSDYARGNPQTWRRRTSNELRRRQDDRYYRDAFARRNVPGEREWARYLRTGGDRDLLPGRWRQWFR